MIFLRTFFFSISKKQWIPKKKEKKAKKQKRLSAIMDKLKSYNANDDKRNRDDSYNMVGFIEENNA